LFESKTLRYFPFVASMFVPLLYVYSQVRILILINFLLIWYHIQNKPESSCLCPNSLSSDRTEVVPAFTVESCYLLDVTSSSIIEIFSCFGGMYCIHLQSWRVGQTSLCIPEASTLHFMFFLLITGYKASIQNKSCVPELLARL
jgi:hypothetical protein